jgi:CheY-like chemotaxis protein
MSVSILIVDDEPDVADLFRQRFRRETRAGTYVLHFAASGEEALDRLTGEIKPQLIVILSDINMPGMDGLELLRVLKERRPELPVMMVTAYGDDERRRRAAEYGAMEFVTKPDAGRLTDSDRCTGGPREWTFFGTTAVLHDCGPNTKQNSVVFTESISLPFIQTTRHKTSWHRTNHWPVTPEKEPTCAVCFVANAGEEQKESLPESTSHAAL